MAYADPHSCFDDAQPRTRSWRLRLCVDFALKVIYGEATLVFAAPASGVLDLDTKALTIRRVAVAGGVREVPFELGPEEPILGRHSLRCPRRPAVSIVYETSPRSSACSGWPDRGRSTLSCSASARPSTRSLCPARTARGADIP